VIDRDRFYFAIEGPFGPLSDSQFKGLDAILNFMESDLSITDNRWRAYELATIKHETADTYRPIEEYGKGKGHTYGEPGSNGQIFFGRGYVQLTWEDNYKSMQGHIGVGLFDHPELALQPETAYKIMSYGMKNGSFTGRRLADYFNDTFSAPLHARKIINGMDQAEKIAGYYEVFKTALS
jgi:predicted chitinase